MKLTDRMKLAAARPLFSLYKHDIAVFLATALFLRLGDPDAAREVTVKILHSLGV